jgi:hypothetical protein
MGDGPESPGRRRVLIGLAGLAAACGDDDPFRDASQELVDRCRPEPSVVSFSPGGHTRAYWNDHTLAAFRFLAEHVEP